MCHLQHKQKQNSAGDGGGGGRLSLWETSVTLNTRLGRKKREDNEEEVRCRFVVARKGSSCQADKRNLLWESKLLRSR